MMNLIRRRDFLLSLAAIADGGQKTFDFHSGFWINLHHTLFNQAEGLRAGRGRESSGAAWDSAVDWYWRNFAGRDIGQVSLPLNRMLANAGNGALKERTEIARVLQSAAPASRDRWWPQHDQKNREWVRVAGPMIARYERNARKALARAYDTPWPHGRMRVEMSYYTTGVAAYTSLRPTLITLSSWSRRNEGAGGIETIFHEAGHAMIDRVQRAIGSGFPTLWHAIIAYTSGEVMRRLISGLVPYGIQYGQWNNEWPGMLPVLDRDWRPFLDGKGSFQDAIARVVRDAPRG